MTTPKLIHRFTRHDGILIPMLAAAVWVLSVGVSGERGPGTEPLPAFHEIEQVDRKKQQFFEYLIPVVQAENERIRDQRARLKEISRAIASGQEPSGADRRFLEELAERYRVKAAESTDAGLVDELLERVDVIPRSLVLVQAAKESGWGSSRFARSANNLFGQWCFDPGCGVVPRNRPAGARHEVERFDTVRDAVASYVRNLNSHPTYEELRSLRARLRAADKPLSGVNLAEGLEGYSERGEAYVREVQAMIRQNELEPIGAGG